MIVLGSEVDGKLYSANFAPDGTYVVDNVPLGKVNVRIELPPDELVKQSGKRPSPQEMTRKLPSIVLQQGQNEFSVNLP